MQLQLFSSGDEIVDAPAVCRPIAARGQQAVENGQEQGAFDGKFKASTAQQFLHNGLASGFLPEAFEDQGRANDLGRDGGDLAVLMSAEDHGFFGEACAGAQQGVELAGVLKLIDPAAGGNDPLSGAAILPVILDDLQVAAGAGGGGAQ